MGCLMGERKSIAVLELLPIALACMVWGRQWKGSLVVIHSDNQAVVHVVNSSYSKGKLMHLIRCMFFFWAYWRVRAESTACTRRAERSSGCDIL